MGIFQNLARPRGVGEGRVGLLNANMHVPADEAEAGSLRIIAPGSRPASQSVLENRCRYRGPFRRSWRIFRTDFITGEKRAIAAGAEIVAVGKAAGQDDGVAIRQVLRLVPDKLDGLVQDVADGVKRVVIAIRAGKNDDSEFHRVGSPRSIQGNSILSTSDSVMDVDPKMLF